MLYIDFTACAQSYLILCDMMLMHWLRILFDGTKMLLRVHAP